MVFRELVMWALPLAAQREFYGGMLGLPVVSDTAEEVAVQIGESRIRFRPAEPGTAPVYHFALNVPANRFVEAKAWLRERAPLLRHEGEDEFDWNFWEASAAYALDPADNIVEIIAHRTLPTATDEPFTTASLLGLSEVGLAVADVPTAVSALQEVFGIGLWDRDAIVPGRITPIGEQGATFIVVPLGRPWFLGPEASDHPLEVVLGGVREGVLELPGHPYRLVGEG